MLDRYRDQPSLYAACWEAIKDILLHFIPEAQPRTRIGGPNHSEHLPR